MPDKPRSFPPHPSDDDDIPASEAFAELMRRVAEQRAREAANLPQFVEDAPEEGQIPHPPTETAQAALPSEPAQPHIEAEAAEDDPAEEAAALLDEIEYTARHAAQMPQAVPASRDRRKERRAASKSTGGGRVRKTVGVFGGIIRSFVLVIAAAGLTATIFTWFTPSDFINRSVRQELSAALATDTAPLSPTLPPTPNWARRIGIVSGHRGPQNDPGAVCPDGLTEAEINFNVASQVVQNLRARGYTVDLLDEFDPRLDNYEASALVSIHANTCQDFGERVSGFLIAAAAARVTARGNDQLLVDCIAQHYAVASGLERREGVTVDMTDYHTFREINALTPAAIIELGFMLADRDLLTGRPDVLADGITDGILCFLEPGVVPGPQLQAVGPEFVPTDAPGA